MSTTVILASLVFARVISAGEADALRLASGLCFWAILVAFGDIRGQIKR